MGRRDLGFPLRQRSATLNQFGLRALTGCYPIWPPASVSILFASDMAPTVAAIEPLLRLTAARNGVLIRLRPVRFYDNTLIQLCKLYRSAGIITRAVHNKRLHSLHQPTLIRPFDTWVAVSIIPRGNLERESGCTNDSNTRLDFFLTQYLRFGDDMVGILLDCFQCCICLALG